MSLHRCGIVLLLLLLLPISLSAQTPSQAINAQKSVITVHVFKAGLFSAFGHNHEISAPIRQGTVSQETQSVQLVVDARNMRVMDKDVSDKDRTEIQQTMLGPKVLDVQNYPGISFRSRQVRPLGEGKWSVEGDLTVRGISRPVTVTVSGADGHYRGSSQITQKDFGIIPVSAAGGTVKTKNEMRVEFEIFTK